MGIFFDRTDPLKGTRSSNPANICTERQTKTYKADFFTNTLDMPPEVRLARIGHFMAKVGQN